MLGGTYGHKSWRHQDRKDIEDLNGCTSSGAPNILEKEKEMLSVFSSLPSRAVEICQTL